MTLTSTLRPAKGKEECVLSWKLPPCISFQNKIMTASVGTPAPVVEVSAFFWTTEDSPLPCERRWRPSHLHSNSLVLFWWRAEGGRGGLKLQVNVGYKRKDSRKRWSIFPVPLMKELSDPLSGSMQAPPDRTSTLSRPSSSAETCDGVAGPPWFRSNSARLLLAAHLSTTQTPNG